MSQIVENPYQYREALQSFWFSSIEPASLAPVYRISPFFQFDAGLRLAAVADDGGGHGLTRL